MNGQYIDFTVFGEISQSEWNEIADDLMDFPDASEIVVDKAAGSVHFEGDDGNFEATLIEAGLSYIRNEYSGNEVNQEYADNSIKVYNSASGASHTFLSDGSEPIITMADAIDEIKMQEARGWYDFYMQNKSATLTLTSPGNNP